MSVLRPKILVTFDYCPERGYQLRREYIEALERQDVEVILAPYNQEGFKSLIKKVDGVLLPGGLRDVDPRSYGEKTLHPTTKLNPSREEFDRFVLDQILERDKVCLAICWAFQLLNVHLGGTLYQDLPSEFGTQIEHEQKQASDTPTHPVLFEPESESRTRLGLEEIMVNSTHHQGVRRLSSELVCEGKSPDGLIEAFRHPGMKYLWGLEWHPERLVADPFIPDFCRHCKGD